MEQDFYRHSRASGNLCFPNAMMGRERLETEMPTFVGMTVER
jgi:hypothetical protein